MTAARTMGITGQDPAATTGKETPHGLGPRIPARAGAAAGIRRASRGRVPLPGPARGRRRAARRTEGIRHVRRMSNWTAAALIVGTGAATVALAHHAFPIGRHRRPGGGHHDRGRQPRRQRTGRADRRCLTPSRRPAASGVTVTTTTHTVERQDHRHPGPARAGLPRQLMDDDSCTRARPRAAPWRRVMTGDAAVAVAERARAGHQRPGRGVAAGEPRPGAGRGG